MIVVPCAESVVENPCVEIVTSAFHATKRQKLLESDSFFISDVNHVTTPPSESQASHKASGHSTVPESKRHKQDPHNWIDISESSGSATAESGSESEACTGKVCSAVLAQTYRFGGERRLDFPTRAI